MPDTKWNSIGEFAASVKEKFPAYKSWNDADLARAMFEKFPQYVGQVQTSQPRKKSTYSSAPPSNVPFLRLAVPELEKQRDEAIAKGDVSTAKEKELFRSTGQGISDLVSDPGNLALGAASMIPGARLAMAPVLGALGLHGMAASGTNIKDIGQETAYATGLTDKPGKYTTPEAAQQYLQSAAMGVGSIAASGEKGATEPTAKLLDRIKRAYVASGQLKSGKLGTPYAKTAMQETGRVAGAVGGYSMGAEFSHPIIAAIVGGKLGKGAGTGAYETGRIVLEAAPKALRSKAFEAYQDSLNRDLFSSKGKGGGGYNTPKGFTTGPVPGSAPGGVDGMDNIRQSEAYAKGMEQTEKNKRLAAGEDTVKPSDLIKREKQFKEEAPDQPSVPMKDVAKLINDGIKKWGIEEVDKFSKGLMGQKPVPNTQERFVAWQNFVENGPSKEIPFHGLQQAKTADEAKANFAKMDQNIEGGPNSYKAIQKKHNELFGQKSTSDKVRFFKNQGMEDNELSLQLQMDIQAHLLEDITSRLGKVFSDKVFHAISDLNFEDSMKLLDRYKDTGPLLKPGDEIPLEGGQTYEEEKTGHLMDSIIQGGMKEINIEFYNLRDKLYDRMDEASVDNLMDDYIRQGIPRHERLVLMQNLINQLDAPKTPAFDNKEWAKALGKVGNLLKPTSRSKPIKLPDIGSGHEEAQYIGAFEALTKMLPKMLGSEGEVIANTLTKAVAEGNMPAQEALVHATAWINEVQRKAYQARSKKTQ